MKCPTCNTSNRPFLSQCVDCGGIVCSTCGFKHLLEHDYLIPLSAEEMIQYD